MSTHRLRLSLLFLGVISSGCATSDATIRDIRPTGSAALSVPVQSNADEAEPATGEDDDAKEGPSLDELHEAVEDASDSVHSAQQKVRYAEAEEGIAQLEARSTELEIEESLRSAATTRDTAKRALESFVSVALPLEVRESELGLAQTEERLHVAETDLAGILQIYSEETEARAKDEIIRRHEKQVEVARARLAIARDEHAHRVEHELTAEQEKLTESLGKAEAALVLAESKAEQKRLRLAFDLQKAKDAIDDANRASERAQAKLDRAKEKLVKAAKTSSDKAEAGR
ncbi:MAG: hypothetical protein AAGA20_08030 [Planctomycetota bacterium]